MWHERSPRRPATLFFPWNGSEQFRVIILFTNRGLGWCPWNISTVSMILICGEILAASFTVTSRQVYNTDAQRASWGFQGLWLVCLIDNPSSVNVCLVRTHLYTFTTLGARTIIGVDDSGHKVACHPKTYQESFRFCHETGARIIGFRCLRPGALSNGHSALCLEVSSKPNGLMLLTELTS